MVQVTTDRGGMAGDRIAFLGHSTVLIELDGVRLLTDPLLRDRVAHLRRQTGPIDPVLTEGVAAVLVSHLHRDHLDLASLRALGRSTPLLAPAGAGAWLRRRGFASVRELGVGESVTAGALSITAVEARHDGRRHPGGVRAQTLGFLVRGARTVYFAGDTELFEGMAELLPGSPIQIDFALLPVSGWGPRLGPGHMDAQDAARAAALLAPSVAIPIHWGTLLPIGGARRHRALLYDPPRLFARHAARLAPGVTVRILEPGQETALTDPSRPSRDRT